MAPQIGKVALTNFNCHLYGGASLRTVFCFLRFYAFYFATSFLSNAYLIFHAIDLGNFFLLKIMVCQDLGSSGLDVHAARFNFNSIDVLLRCAHRRASLNVA